MHQRTISTAGASQRARRPPRCWPSWYASAAVTAPAAATVDDARQARRKFMAACLLGCVCVRERMHETKDTISHSSAVVGRCMLVRVR